MFEEPKQPKQEERPAVGSVETMLEEVYGQGAVEDFEAMWKQHPKWSLEEALKRYEEEPTSQQSYFFRSRNIQVTAEQLVPMLEKKEGKPVEILDVGVSSGEEAYGLAVHMLEAGHQNFNIHGVDVSIDRLTEAEAGEYRFWLGSINELGRGSSRSLTPDHIQKGYFRDSGKRWQRKERSAKYNIKELVEMKRRGESIPEDAWNKIEQIIIEPTEKLKDHTSFDRHDMIDGPVKDWQYDVAIVNRVLLHYPEKTREKILRNVLQSLKPGGFLVLEHIMTPLNDRERKYLTPYNKWRGEITEKFPLEEVAVKRDPSDPQETAELTGEFYRFVKTNH